MRSYNPIDPFSLDEPDVRLPAGTSMFDTLPPVGKLIDDLEALGVDVPDAARWRDLAAATQAPPGPQSTPDLESSVEEVLGYIRESAALASADTAPARQRAAKALDKAVLASIRAHADQIIAGLKPEFDRGVQAIQVARDLGITADDDARTMRRATNEIRAAFEALAAVAGHLDKILAVRQKLSLWAGVAPSLNGMAPEIASGYRQGIYPSSIDWTIVVTKPGSSTVQLSKRDPGRPWLRWLDIADYLYLPTVSELGPEDLLVAYGHDLASLQVAAVQRLEGIETGTISRVGFATVGTAD